MILRHSNRHGTSSAFRLMTQGPELRLKDAAYNPNNKIAMGVFDRRQKRASSVGIEFITWRAEINQAFCHAERLDHKHHVE